MRIEQSVEVDAPLDQVWALVNDVPRVAPCMPGATLTKVVDERTYEGTVTVKLGPIRMAYKGTVVLEQVDEANHSARMAASARETKGAGTARATVETRLEADGDERTRMLVVSDLQLTGKVASFGRGAIADVANRLFGQFAACLRDSLSGEGAGGEAAAAEREKGAALDAGGLIGTVVAGRAKAVAESVSGLMRKRPHDQEEEGKEGR